MKKVLILAAIVLAGCEKVVIEDAAGLAQCEQNVVLKVTAGDRTTRGDVALSDACGRLSVAVFDADGTKVKTVAQSVSDAGFGTVPLAIMPGTYTIVAVAHNGTGAATITSGEKVTFPNNKVTDTFYYYGQVTATKERQDVAVIMKRSVAMLRLMLTGESLRTDIAQLKFYYLGGSSTFSPRDGFGCVNSKQTEYRAWNEEGVYELYTMPHTTDDVLTKVTVTAYDAGDNEVGAAELVNIPVTVNRVTNYAGDIFSGGGAVNAELKVDPAWAGVDDYTF
jgi:hypothetical protein